MAKELKPEDPLFIDGWEDIEDLDRFDREYNDKNPTTEFTKEEVERNAKPGIDGEALAKIFSQRYDSLGPEKYDQWLAVYAVAMDDTGDAIKSVKIADQGISEFENEAK